MPCQYFLSGIYGDGVEGSEWGWIYCISSEKMIISEYLDIVEDDKERKMEYRVYVIDCKIVDISRYIDYDTNYEIPKKIQKFAEDFIEAHKKLIPKHYCLDILELKNGKVVIGELNGIMASGRYEKINHENFINQVLKIK